MADKTLSSQSHVEELTRMRTELAQERASIAIFKQEVLKKKRNKLLRSGFEATTTGTSLVPELSNLFNMGLGTRLLWLQYFKVLRS